MDGSIFTGFFIGFFLTSVLFIILYGLISGIEIYPENYHREQIAKAIKIYHSFRVEVICGKPVATIESLWRQTYERKWFIYIVGELVKPKMEFYGKIQAIEWLKNNCKDLGELTKLLKDFFEII